MSFTLLIDVIHIIIQELCFATIKHYEHFSNAKIKVKFVDQCYMFVYTIGPLVLEPA